MTEEFEPIDIEKLSPELQKEIEKLDKMDAEKIQQLYASSQERINEIDDPTKAKKLIACPHEIVFTITARVMEENMKGEVVGDKDISIRHYHIPVPIDKDYKVYVATFFKYIESKMLDGINHANENSQENSQNG